MEIKTSDSYQKEVLNKYKEDKGGDMMSGYLSSPTRSSIRNACLWLLDRRKEKNDEYILNRFFQFREGEDKARHIQGLKSEKADKFVPIIRFLKGKTNDTSDENLELISWLIDFQPRPLQEYLRSDWSSINGGVSQNKKENINKGKDDVFNKEDNGGTRQLNDSGDDITVTPTRKWLTISISIAFGIVCMIFGVQKWTTNHQGNNSAEYKCMAWADSLYVEVSCDNGPFSRYGTKLESLDPMKLAKMRKVEVDAAYKFFSDANEPLIWYYKKSSKEIEYFTASGLHPTNGETLRKITPYIIETYVPIHSKKESSFIR